MTVAALFDVGVGAGANVGSAVGPGAGAGAGNGAGGALLSMGAQESAKGLGTTNDSSSKFIASNGRFRAQWELAVNEQSRGGETPPEEKSTELTKTADGVHAQNFQEDAAEASLSMPSGTTANSAAVNASGRMYLQAQSRAIAWTAQESTTQSELVTANTALGSKTRDGVAAKSAEHNLPAKDIGAPAGPGDPAILAMTAMQPLPIGAVMQQPAPIRQPAVMIPAFEPASTARAMEPAQELPSGSAGGPPAAALHMTAKFYLPSSDFAEVSSSVASHAGAPHAVAADLALPAGFAEASRVTPVHVTAAHSALSKNSVETAASASGGGTRAALETPTAQQNELELPGAGFASNPAMSGPAYASSESSAAALPNRQIAGMQLGISGSARVQGRKAVAAAETTDSANTSGGDGSKLDAIGFDATPGRQKSVETSSVSATSGPAAIMHSAQAVNSGSDASASIRVTASGEGGSNLTATHAGASGNAAALAPVGSAGRTFAALDAGTNVGTPSWVHANSQRAEAGFEDPVLGWVGVRADVVSGTVHAAILPGSADAAAALSTHLAGLGAYLSEQHAPVSAVTVATPAQQGIETGVGQNLHYSAQQNGGGDNRGAREAPDPTGGTATLGPASWSGPADISGMVSMDSLGGMRGANISVMV